MNRLEQIKKNYLLYLGKDGIDTLHGDNIFWLIDKLEKAIEMAKRIRSPQYNAEYQATEFLRELE